VNGIALRPRSRTLPIYLDRPKPFPCCWFLLPAHVHPSCSPSLMLNMCLEENTALSITNYPIKSTLLPDARTLLAAPGSLQIILINERTQQLLENNGDLPNSGLPNPGVSLINRSSEKNCNTN
jgi:hypothetical protein